MNTCLRYLYADSNYTACLGPKKQILWGVKEILHQFTDSKKTPATQILSGPIPRRPPEKIRR